MLSVCDGGGSGDARAPAAVFLRTKVLQALLVFGLRQDGLCEQVHSRQSGGAGRGDARQRAAAARHKGSSVWAAAHSPQLSIRRRSIWPTQKQKRKKTASVHDACSNVRLQLGGARRGRAFARWTGCGSGASPRAFAHRRKRHVHARARSLPSASLPRAASMTPHPHAMPRPCGAASVLCRARAACTARSSRPSSRAEHTAPRLPAATWARGNERFGLRPAQVRRHLRQ